MSQKDRQEARQRALVAKDALHALIENASVSDPYREQMEARLYELWVEMDLACGGKETRP